MVKSRDRVKNALNHTESDRIPIDNNGFASGMHEAAYRNLLNYLNIEDDIKIFDYVQRLALVKDEILDMFGVDTRYIFPKSPSNFIFGGDADNEFKDEFGVVYKRKGYYADCIKPPLAGKSFEDIKSYNFPDASDPSRFERLDSRAKSLYENTDFSIWAGHINSLFYTAWILRGMENFMVDLYSDPKLAKYLMDRIVDWNMEFFKGFYGKVGSYIDVFWIGDDWGTQNGPLISPDYFRKEIVPRFKKMISFIKTMTNAKCCYHCCGSIYWCMEDLIDMGADIIHPVQANAEGNDSEKLKNKFGDRICFHGGTNNQGVFHKDVHSLAIDTLNRIKYLAPGGGYIFSSGHNIQANMPPENIIRLFEISRIFGKYPIDIDSIGKQIEIEKGSIDK
ncbi:MAG: hypothetical protein M1475_08605 [Actinobacteria bacterium]|nr:hypothetical protein [Actinomycetota bacterium]MCL6088458.1 hypothetical protein [Actinomycetota bacterium]